MTLRSTCGLILLVAFSLSIGALFFFNQPWIGLGALAITIIFAALFFFTSLEGS